MEIVTYGHYGFPVLLFPTLDFLEYERFHVIEAISDSLEAGRCKVFCVDGINSRSWLSPGVHPRHKGALQQLYNSYLVDEVAPYIWNSCEGRQGIITAGASLGAFQAANQLFRRPDIFDGMVAMSGVYDLRKYYDPGDYQDSNLYFNNVAEYLPRLEDDYFLPLLRRKEKIAILSGQGSFENPAASRWLSAVLRAQGIRHRLDLWGFDRAHGWSTWRAMFKLYLSNWEAW